MSDFEETLERLGLSEYAHRFISEGFDSWETLLDIQESDLEALAVKLGHRRKLQRAIAESRPEQGLPSLSHQSSNGSAAKELSAGKTTPESIHATSRPKRRYKRHPKPDPFAPERPVSAYVLFSNDVRERMKNDGQELNFCDMAKVVGEQWQNLSIEERDRYEASATQNKAEYNAQLAEYKKTEQYAEYQKYLAEFKANHKDSATSPGPRAETKRTKLQHQSSTSSSMSSNDRSLSSHQSSVASPSSLSVHSDANNRADMPNASSPRQDLYASSRTAMPGPPTAHEVRHDPRSNPVTALPPYNGSELPDRYARRRSASYTIGHGPPPILTSRPLIPAATQEPPHPGPSLPPIRSAGDRPMVTRALPPPIPSLGKASNLGFESRSIKQDPFETLLAAAESQAPRLPIPGPADHGRS